MTANPTAGAPSAPGYYLGIPNAAYHAGPGVSKSQLDLVHVAPALLQWSQNAPRDEEARAAVDLGTALHTTLLEPDRFAEDYVTEFQPPAGAIVSTDDLKLALDERGIGYSSKDTKPSLTRKLLDMDPDAPVLDRLREAWQTELDGREILTASDVRKLRLMRESVMAHPFARALLEADGDVEASTYWIDPITGLLCRKRVDKLVRLGQRRILLDVKSTAELARFGFSIDEYRYHVQDAFYREGYERHHGEPPDGFVFLVVGSQRDAGRYPVRTFNLTPEEVAAGRAEFRADLDTFARCRDSGNWPGLETISRPHWRRAA